MSYTLIAHGSVAQSGAVATVSGLNTTGADLLVAIWVDYLNGSLDIGDSQSNTWIRFVDYEPVNGGYIIGAYCSSPTTNSSHNFTHNTGSGSSLAISAWAGSKTIGTLLDVASQASNSPNTTQQPGNITPTTNGCLVLSACHNGGTSPTVSGSTMLDIVAAGANEGLAVSYTIQTSATAINPTFSSNTSSDLISAAIQAFLPISSGGSLLRINNNAGIKDLTGNIYG